MPLAVVTTNLSKGQIKPQFLQCVTNSIVEILGCEEKYTMVELHADIPMMRGGTTDPTANMYFHHNDDKINEETKRDIAGKLAAILVNELNIPSTRILVLFFDTRCTTLQITHL